MKHTKLKKWLGNLPIFSVRQSSIDRKIERLGKITSNFLIVEYYTHTGKYMYKICNEYTKYKEEKFVLCAVEEGISKALDLAIKTIGEKKTNYFA
jgi:hypothetical protein